MHGANDDDDSCWEMATKVGLVVCGILLFIVVFWSACLSRIIIHIMIWKLNPPYTNNNFTLNRLGGTLMQQLQRMRLDICDGFTPDDCTKGQVVRGGLPESWVCRNETAVTCLLWEEIPSVNVGWIWGLLIIMSVPYIYTMIVSLWRICFKKNKVDDFNLKMFFVVSIKILQLT